MLRAGVRSVERSDADVSARPCDASLGPREMPNCGIRRYATSGTRAHVARPSFVTFDKSSSAAATPTYPSTYLPPTSTARSSVTTHPFDLGTLDSFIFRRHVSFACPPLNPNLARVARHAGTVLQLDRTADAAPFDTLIVRWVQRAGTRGETARPRDLRIIHRAEAEVTFLGGALLNSHETYDLLRFFSDWHEIPATACYSHKKAACVCTGSRVHFTWRKVANGVLPAKSSDERRCADLPSNSR